MHLHAAACSHGLPVSPECLGVTTANCVAKIACPLGVTCLRACVRVLAGSHPPDPPQLQQRSQCRSRQQVSLVLAAQAGTAAMAAAAAGHQT